VVSLVPRREPAEPLSAESRTHFEERRWFIGSREKDPEEGAHV